MADSRHAWKFWAAVVLGFVVFVFCNLIGLAVWFARIYEEDQIARTRSGVSTVNPSSGDGDLRIDAWTNTTRVSAGGMLPFSIAIQNPSAKTAVRDVRFVAFDAAEGFAVPTTGRDALCWSGKGEPKPICVTADNLTAYPAQWPLIIDAGGGTTVATRLRAVGEPGRWSVTAVLAWTDPLHHISRRKGISLGPVVVESAFRKDLLLLVRAFQSYVKDLAWPVLALLFGFWVSQQDRRRTQEREAEKTAADRRAQLDRDARASSERQAQENRAMVQQTWTLMLPKSHQNNEKFYMPISHASREIHRAFARIGKDPFAEDECFYDIWILHRIMTDFVRKAGGWYLKNRRGEEIVASAWRVILGWTKAVIAAQPNILRSARAIREEAVSKFPRRPTTFAYFQDTLSKVAPFPDLRRWFGKALADPAAANIMTVIELFEFVIDFEINRAYVYWYGGESEMVPFPSDEYKDITDRFERTRVPLTNPPYDDLLQDLALEISRYRKAIEGEAKKQV
jgi:hypothetical protein